jgi:hypothetical protein
MRLFVSTLCGVAVVAAVLLALHHGEIASAQGRAGNLGPGAPAVIVELFSSEGCSSCPPADAYLKELDRAQPIPGVTVVALEEHVDYWNYLGWKDPFSQASFSARQQDYAAVLPGHQVYTPEIVIDGHAVVEGGDESQAARDLQAGAREARAKVDMGRSENRLNVVVSDVPSVSSDPAEVWLAVTESGLTTKVERGENAGKTLAHGPVVRTLQKLGGVVSGSFHADVPLGTDAGWKTGALRSVVFVQRAESKRIVGAAIR